MPRVVTNDRKCLYIGSIQTNLGGLILTHAFLGENVYFVAGFDGKSLKYG